MEEWVHFFVGTPRRFAVTVSVLFIAFAAIFPMEAQQMMRNVLAAVFGALAPFAEPALLLLIIAYGFVVMTRPLRKKKKGRDH